MERPVTVRGEVRVDRCAVLLRGVNVGRGNRLAMADLRAALERAGCTQVSTVLNSGNGVVTADPAGLAARVEAELPLPVRVVVFTAAELAEAVAACPWPDRAAATPKQVHVSYLERLPDPDRLAALGTVHGGDEVAVGPRVLYLSYAQGSLDGPLAKALSRTDLGVVMTTRGWPTATKLAALTET